MRKTQIFTAAALALVLGACGGAGPSQPTAGGSTASCSTRAYDNIGGPFSLIDHTGKAVTEADYKGTPSLIYFGFTYCPDICPGTLVAINNAFELLPDDITPPQTLLITVDPERDTPEALATYISAPAFPDNLVGLTGSSDQIAAAAEAFVASYDRIETPDSLSEYTMDHTSILYLMDEDWKLSTFFAESDSNPQDMAKCLAEHLS